MPRLEHVLPVLVAANRPAFIWGPPGEGKSTITKKVCRVLDVECIVVMLSLRDPTDIGGLPVNNGDGTVSLAPPQWAMRAKQLADAGRSVVVFFDEMNTATPATQAACLRVIEERVIGDLELPFDRVLMLAAGNPLPIAAGGFSLAPAMANRFAHVHYSPDVEDDERWLNGLVLGFPDPEVPRVAPDWQERYLGSANGMVQAFLRSKMQNIRVDVTALPQDRRSGAFPTRRAWTAAAQLLAAAEGLQAGPAVKRAVRTALLKGTVGDVGQEYFEWEEKLDLPDPEEVLRHPTTFRLPPRSDQQYALLSNVTTAVIGAPERCTPERWCAAWEVMATVAKAKNPDIAATSACLLAKAKKTIPALANVAAPVAPLLIFTKVLDNAGIRLNPAA